nr:hypothetical protein [Tanacetum cinerariifolium]
MIEPDKPLKKKDQIALDEEATIDADRKLAEQIQAQEREQLSIKERSKLLAELIKSRRNSKRAGQELEKESAKKQKLAGQEQAKVANDDTKELKICLKIVHEDDDDVAIKATSISSKLPTIVGYKIYKEGKKSYFKIIRADGNSQNYLTFGTMFKNFNREDLKVLKSIVKERLHGVNTAQLVLLVYKVVVVFNKVNATKSRLTTDVRVSTAGWIKWLEEQDMQVNEIY